MFIPYQSAFLAGKDQGIPKVDSHRTQRNAREILYQMCEYSFLLFFFFLVASEAGYFSVVGVLGFFDVLVSSPKEAKFLSCSCSNVSEATP